MPPLQPHLVPDSVSIKSLVLEVVSDRGTREAIVVKAGEVAEMGRATLLRLGFPSDPHMSARHFAVECDGAQSSVRDLGSRNGTFVNGAKVTEVTLKDGDRIDAGRSSFLIRLRRDAEPDRDDGSRPASVMTRPTKPDMEPVAGTASPVTRATGEGTVTDHRAPAPAPSIPLLEVAKNSPMPVGTVRWHDADGKAKLTIVIKATFTVGAGPEPTPKQLPIFNADIVKEEDPGSVRFESDLVPFKPCTDVVLVGRA